ncbi:MAG: cold shock domain-containing protein [Acidimicrobiales bacterium]
MIGVVDEFDEPRGIGWVRADDGRRLLFHCTAVADGSRRVAQGTRVVFTVVAGHGGEYEAAAVTPVTPVTGAAPA